MNYLSVIKGNKKKGIAKEEKSLKCSMLLIAMTSGSQGNIRSMTESKTKCSRLKHKILKNSSQKLT